MLTGNAYMEKMSKYNELTRLIDGKCSRQCPKTLALKFTLETFEQTVKELQELYEGYNWRVESVLEGIVYAMELKKVPAQKRVIRFMELSGSVTSDTLYRIFNKKTIDCMFEKGLIKSESKSRLRTDDMEMVYWSEVTLVTKLEKSVK